MMEWKEFREEVWELVDKLNFQEKQLENFDDFENALKAKKKDSDVWQDFECKFWDINVAHYQNIFFSRNTLELMIAEEKAQAKEEIISIEQQLATLIQKKAFEQFKGEPGTDSDGGAKGPEGKPLRIKVSEVFPEGEEE